MTREEIILKHIKRDGLGLEIGASCAPVAPKKRGFRVHVLDDCDSLLKKGGVLSLVVPDKRYCFDRFRPLTDVGRVIDAARNPQKFIRPERRLNIFLR